MRKFYRVEVFGFLGEKEKENLVHLYGVDHLKRRQMLKVTSKLNAEGLVYQIAMHEAGTK